MYFFQALSLILSALLFWTTYMSYKDRTSTSVSAFMSTSIMPIESWKNDITGLILPTENYLDLFITNGGPGIANNITWQLFKMNKDNSKTEIECRQLPYIYVGRDINVRGYIKIDSESRFDTKYFCLIYYSNSWPHKRVCIKIDFNGFGDLLQSSNFKCKSAN